MSSISLASSLVSSHNGLDYGVQPYEYYSMGSVDTDAVSLSTRSEYLVNKYAEKTERKGHHIFKLEVSDLVKVFDNNENIMKEILRRKRVKVSVFETFPMINQVIVNAVTGIAYTKDDNIFYRYGSNDELELFKVKDVSRGKSGMVFFYDSPEQYERHMYATLNKETKEKWHKRNMARQ